MQSQHVKTKIEESFTRYLFGENSNVFGLLIIFLWVFNILIPATLVFDQTAPLSETKISITNDEEGNGAGGKKIRGLSDCHLLVTHFDSFWRSNSVTHPIRGQMVLWILRIVKWRLSRVVNIKQKTHLNFLISFPSSWKERKNHRDERWWRFRQSKVPQTNSLLRIEALKLRKDAKL